MDADNQGSKISDGINWWSWRPVWFGASGLVTFSTYSSWREKSKRRWPSCTALPNDLRARSFPALRAPSRCTAGQFCKFTDPAWYKRANDLLVCYLSKSFPVLWIDRGLAGTVVKLKYSLLFMSVKPFSSPRQDSLAIRAERGGVPRKGLWVEWDDRGLEMASCILAPSEVGQHRLVPHKPKFHYLDDEPSSGEIRSTAVLDRSPRYPSYTFFKATILPNRTCTTMTRPSITPPLTSLIPFRINDCGYVSRRFWDKIRQLQSLAPHQPPRSSQTPSSIQKFQTGFAGTIHNAK